MDKQKGLRTIEVPAEEIEKIANALLAGLKRGQVGFLKEGQTSVVQARVWDVRGKEWIGTTRMTVVWPGLTGAKHRELDEQHGLAEIDVSWNDVGLGKDLGFVVEVVKGGQKVLEMRPGSEDLTAEEKAEFEAARLRILVSILTHEFTHARDVRPGAGYYEPGQTAGEPNSRPGSFDKATVEQRKRYLNQPVEVRAIINQVLVELGPHLESGLDWKTLLQKSPSWTTMVEPYLEPKKKARVIEAVQRWLENQ